MVIFKQVTWLNSRVVIGLRHSICSNLRYVIGSRDNINISIDNIASKSPQYDVVLHLLVVYRYVYMETF